MFQPSFFGRRLIGLTVAISLIALSIPASTNGQGFGMGSLGRGFAGASFARGLSSRSLSGTASRSTATQSTLGRSTTSGFGRSGSGVSSSASLSRSASNSRSTSLNRSFGTNSSTSRATTSTRSASASLKTPASNSSTRTVPSNVLSGRSTSMNRSFGARPGTASAKPPLSKASNPLSASRPSVANVAQRSSGPAKWRVPINQSRTHRATISSRQRTQAVSQRSGLGKNGIDQHHIVPKKFANHPVMKHVGSTRSRTGMTSMGINSRSNLVSLPRRSSVNSHFKGFRSAKGGNTTFSTSRTQHKAHANYNARMESRLNEIQKLPKNQWSSKVRELQNQHRIQFKSGKIGL